MELLKAEEDGVLCCSLAGSISATVESACKCEIVIAKDLLVAIFRAVFLDLVQERERKVTLIAFSALLYIFI